MIEFRYLAKNEFNKYAGKLFSILFDNMTKIASTGNSREKDYNSWYEAVSEGMKSDKRHIIVISKGNIIFLELCMGLFLNILTKIFVSLKLMQIRKIQKQ